MDDGVFYAPATQLAGMIRGKEISPVELVDGLFERVHRLEPKLNAFVVLVEDAARAEARRAEQQVMDGDALGPLHGVPITIKDFIDVEGLPTTFGSYIHKDNVAKSDAVVTKRVHDAGAIVIGKTTGPDYGWKATSDCPLTGSTPNPWNTAHTAGGSSAGAASAVACGLAPLALGTDGAGSVRIPASFCGIVGMKATYGRVPQPGQSPANTSHTGPMTRTVADAALLLRVIAGPVESDPVTLQQPPDDYPALLDPKLAGKKIAYSPDLGFVSRVDPTVAARCRETAEALKEAGAIVEEASPDWGDPMQIIMDMWPAIWAGRIGDKLEAFRDRLDPALVACTEEGLRQDPATFVRAQIERVAYCERAYRFFEQYDYLLTPSVAVPAFEVGRLRPADYPDHPWEWFSWSPFSFPFNFTWHPAITVPAGHMPDARPIGLQIVGRRFDDMGVLNVAAAVEAVRPWKERTPEITHRVG